MSNRNTFTLHLNPTERHIDGVGGYRSSQVMGISIPMAGGESIMIRSADLGQKRPKLEQYELGLPGLGMTRLLGYFQRYIAASSKLKRPGWNGHTFAAAVAGLGVEWGDTRTPVGLRLGGVVAAEELERGQPYLVARGGEIRHSVVAVGDGKALHVPGFRAALHLTNTEMVTRVYGDTVHEHTGLRPLPTSAGELNGAYPACSYDIPEALAPAAIVANPTLAI